MYIACLYRKMPINERMNKKILLMPLILLIGACANNSAIRLKEEAIIPVTEAEFAEAGVESEFTGFEDEFIIDAEDLLESEEPWYIAQEPEFIRPEHRSQITQEQVLPPEDEQHIAQEQQPAELAELPVPEDAAERLKVSEGIPPVDTQQIAPEQALQPVDGQPHAQGQIPVEVLALPFIELPTQPPVPEYILGQGQIDAEILSEFLTFYHPEMYYFSIELSNLYAEEAAIEGINHDIAFAQMCLETGFLRFGGLVLREMNNFCGLGALGPAQRGVWFPDPRTGVRAHIQHLKAYATEEPLIQELVDPRYNLVRLGSAPKIGGLAGTWAVDLQYGQKINSILERLYEFSFQRNYTAVY
jgi:hypothetical protein